MSDKGLFESSDSKSAEAVTVGENPALRRAFAKAAKVSAENYVPKSIFLASFHPSTEPR